MNSKDQIALRAFVFYAGRYCWMEGGGGINKWSDTFMKWVKGLPNDLILNVT